MNKKKYKTRQVISKVKEPAVRYNSKSRSKNNESSLFISTRQEQDESNYAYWLSLTPEQRIDEHFNMIENIAFGIFKASGHKHQNNGKEKDNRIVFDA